MAEGWIESNTAEVSMMYGNGKVGYPAASFSEGGVYARLYADKNLATKINEVEVNGAGVFVNGIDIAGKIDELNRNLQPTVMFSGNRDIKQTGTWNDTLNFTNFASVRFTIRFQNQISVLWVRPMNDDTLIHTFSTAFYSNDGAFRILFGRLKFAGRYIERAEFKLSYNFGTPGDLGAGYIYVLEILGFKY